MKLSPALVSFVLFGLLAAKEKAPVYLENDVVKLDTYKVRGDPINSFALAMRILFSADHKITKVVVTEVIENSDAQALGLQVGDEIVAINGEPVASMEPRVTKDSRLGRAFLNREPGDTIDLAVVTRRTKQVTLRAAYWRPHP
jgi:S1-C subfamily serine protease